MPWGKKTGGEHCGFGVGAGEGCDGIPCALAEYKLGFLSTGISPSPTIHYMVYSCITTAKHQLLSRKGEMGKGGRMGRVEVMAFAPLLVPDVGCCLLWAWFHGCIMHPELSHSSKSSNYHQAGRHL